MKKLLVLVGVLLTVAVIAVGCSQSTTEVTDDTMPESGMEDDKMMDDEDHARLRTIGREALSVPLDYLAEQGSHTDIRSRGAAPARTGQDWAADLGQTQSPIVVWSRKAWVDWVAKLGSVRGLVWSWVGSW